MVMSKSLFNLIELRKRERERARERKGERERARERKGEKPSLDRLCCQFTTGYLLVQGLSWDLGSQYFIFYLIFFVYTLCNTYAQWSLPWDWKKTELFVWEQASSNCVCTMQRLIARPTFGSCESSSSLFHSLSTVLLQTLQFSWRKYS